MQIKQLSKAVFVTICCTLIAGVALVPQVRLAFTIGTGIGVQALQIKIEDLQSRAIKGNFNLEDKAFLKLFYRTLAYGAQMTFLLPESARLMHHYLDRSGTTTSIDPALFIRSSRVKEEIKTIKKKILEDCTIGKVVKSDRFDMGHGYPIDAHFALYFGAIEGKFLSGKGLEKIQWTADMPWKWPTYKEIKNKYGTYYKEIFPLPNAMSLLGLGPKLWLPNALGGELAKQGLAVPFDTKTVWTEAIKC